MLLTSSAFSMAKRSVLGPNAEFSAIHMPVLPHSPLHKSGEAKKYQEIKIQRLSATCIGVKEGLDVFHKPLLHLPRPSQLLIHGLRFADLTLHHPHIQCHLPNPRQRASRTAQMKVSGTFQIEARLLLLGLRLAAFQAPNLAPNLAPTSFTRPTSASAISVPLSSSEDSPK